ncbi:unnamed protein product [Prunus brigantina]
MRTKMLNMSALNLESECKEIHDSWGQLNQLALALAGRTRLERQQIRETYKAIYGEDLGNRLQKAEQIDDNRKQAAAGVGVSPKLCAALSMWMKEQHERDAIVAQVALDDQQGDTNYSALVEIFVGRKSSQILLIKQAYQRRFGRQLDQDIIHIEPPHPYQKILVALVASHKAHQADISQHIAKSDARRLYETGEGSSGPIEAVVLEILSKRSIPQLKLTFSCYKHIYGHEYTEYLKTRNSGEFENAMKTVVQCIYRPATYFATILYASIKGSMTDKGALARVMVNRAEVDMDEIQREFKRQHGIELRDALCDSDKIPSGDYRDFLVALTASK